MATMTRTELMASVVVPRAEADSALTTALGGLRIFQSQSSYPVLIPSVAWTVIGERPLENDWRVDVQFDYWALDSSSADTIRARLIALYHWETRRTLGGVNMLTTNTEGRMLEYKPPGGTKAGNEQPGVIYGMLRFRFELDRARYTT